METHVGYIKVNALGCRVRFRWNGDQAHPGSYDILFGGQDNVPTAMESPIKHDPSTISRTPKDMTFLSP